MIVDLGAFIEKIRKDFAFRTLVFSCCSLAAEIAYAAFNFVVCTIYRSTWYGAAGCYQLALAIMRGGVLYRRNADAKRAPARADVREIRRYAACGGAIALLTVFLSAMVVLIAGRAKTFIYSPTVMYIHAGYTFYVLGAAVYNFFKSRRQKNFTVRTLRCINLAAAPVCFLSLQSAALALYSQHLDQPTANAVTGCIVCALVLALGAFMIANAVYHQIKGIDSKK